MTMRISTAGLHLQGLNALMNRQQELSKLQQQMTTGNKLTSASIDPAGAAQAQRIDHAVATLEHFDRNASLLGNRLSQQEESLRDAGDYMSRVRELTVQANTSTVSPEDRKVIALEIRQIREQMLAIANREDGNGRALFAGQRDGVVPFADSGGVVTYVGDDGQNRVDVAPDMSLADNEPGSAVFMRVRTGNGDLSASAAATNTGTLMLHDASITDYGAWPGQYLRLEFTAPDSYRLVRADNSVVSTGVYNPGDTISGAGLQIRLSGSPLAGDSVELQPSPNRDVFATLQGLIDTLETPVISVGERTRMHNALTASLADVAQAQEHFFAIRASGGARLSALDSSADTRDAQNISLRSTLSDLRDVDYAQAASQLSLHLTAIEAAQKTMLRIQGSSLFDKL